MVGSIGESFLLVKGYLISKSRGNLGSDLGSGLAIQQFLRYHKIMARPLRIELAGGLYHVTSHGDRREDIFLCEADRYVWLDIFGDVCKRFNWACHAWCQMTNHYHVVAETVEGNLSRGTRQLNGVYTQKLNRTHRRVGHVFQGRYRVIMVEKDAYLLSATTSWTEKCATLISLGEVTSTITINKDYRSKQRMPSSLEEEDTNAPDHLPIMLSFVQNSTKYLDNKNCNFDICLSVRLILNKYQ